VTAPADILSAVGLLRAERLLDWTGGALSARSGSDRMAITRTGAARRLWRLDESDLVDVPIRDGAGAGGASMPLSAGLHALIHRLVPSAAVVVHTHAGSMFTASCLAGGDLPVLPPVRKFGITPLVGVRRHGGTATGGTDQERMRSTTSEAEGLLSHWAGRLYRETFVFLDRDHGAYAFSSSFELALVALAKLEAACCLWLASRTGGDRSQA
jgi:ribulose-5-phosphate 4-epimerase/fuculose-1-phosphate aldolase